MGQPTPPQSSGQDVGQPAVPSDEGWIINGRDKEPKWIPEGAERDYILPRDDFWSKNKNTPLEFTEAALPSRTGKAVGDGSAHKRRKMFWWDRDYKEGARSSPHSSGQDVDQPAVPQSSGQDVDQPAVPQSSGQDVGQPALPQSSGQDVDQPAVPQSSGQDVDQPAVPQSSGQDVDQPAPHRSSGYEEPETSQHRSAGRRLASWLLQLCSCCCRPSNAPKKTKTKR